mgnify:CR=1 FL=1|jgi:hypothetical protein
MTDIPTDELFPQEGSVRPVTVEPKDNAATPSVPESEPVESASLGGSGSVQEKPTVTAVKVPKPSVECSFAARIAKVQRQTVDIKQQLDNINFTDQ